jgi:sensor histidine kinase YesM
MAYIGYFLVITATYFLLNIPLIVMAANLLFLFLLTLMYNTSLKKSILSVSVIYFSLMIIETFFSILTSYPKLNLLKPFHYESEFGIIVLRLASLVLALLFQGFKNVKCEVPMPNVYWVSLLAVPSGTVAMLFVIFSSSSVSRSLLLICMGCALAINILTSFLYDKISFLLTNQMEQRLAQEQTRFYEHQVQIMKTSLESIRILRHDLKNKLSPLYSLAQAGQSEELLHQLSELTYFYGVNQEYVNCGNNTIDSIINFKLNSSRNLNISISTDILIPEKLSLPTFDIAVILGNLLDNAIEAVANIHNRWIDIKLRYTKGRLIIEINNSYDGKLIKVGSKFLSCKTDKENHGFGLKSVQAALQNYDGAMQISHDSNKFTVKALLYLCL